MDSTITMGEEFGRSELSPDSAPVASSVEGASIMLTLLGSWIADEPSRKSVQPLMENGFFDDLPYAAHRPFTRDALRGLREWQANAQETGLDKTVESLQVEWFRAFVGAGLPVAPPWQTYYTDEESLLFTEETLEVRGNYRSYGLELQNKNHEPDDHLGIMLAFLGHLAMLEAQCDKEEEAERIRRDQLAFLRSHVLVFVDAWAANVTQRLNSPFYSGIALLVLAAVRQRTEDLEVALGERRAS